MYRRLLSFFSICSLILAAAQCSDALAEVDASICATQQACVAHIETLRTNRGSNPLEALQGISRIKALSKTKKWQRALLYASTYQLELYLKQENILEADALYNDTMNMAAELSDSKIVTRLMIANLKIRFAQGEIENISALYAPLKERAQESDSLSEKGEIYLAIGLSEQGNLRLAEATRAYQQAYDFFEQTKDSVSKALVLNSLADAYRHLDDTERAIEYFHLALALHRDVGDMFGESVVLYNLGSVYLKAEQFQRSEAAFNSAFDISKGLQDTIGIAWAQSALADLALRKGDWETALFLLQKAEPVFVEAGDREAQLDCALFQTNAYIQAGELANAESKLALSRRLLPPGSAVSGYFDFNATETKIALAKADHRRAYESLKKNFDWVIRKSKHDKEQQAQKYKAEFDTQLKEKQNEVLQKENELKQLKIIEQQSAQKLWVLIITLAVALLLFVATLLYFQTKNRNRFKALAMRDHLTNSPNRRAVLQYAQDRLSEAAHSEASLIIAIADLDSFKNLNDSFGHDVGDEVLKNFALACSAGLRKQDGFGRYGGEEWLFVFFDVDISEIERIFERLREHLNALEAKGLPKGHQITFSMGAAQYHRAEHENIDALLKRADEQLYLAKDNGRNRLAYDGRPSRDPAQLTTKTRG